MYCEPVQEIMGITPSWPIRWGISVISAVFLLILIGCCIIRYPTTISSSISINSENPPLQLEAGYTGIIDTIAVINGQTVKQGDLIALLKTPAVYRDILFARSFADSSRFCLLTEIACSSIFDKKLVLGSIQGVWIEILNLLKIYQQYSKMDLIEKNRDVLFSQIDTIDKSATPKMLTLEQEILKLGVQRGIEKNWLNLRYSRTIGELLDQIEIWIEKYAIIAPFDGIVYLHDFLGSGQQVHAGEIFASIYPSTDSRAIGKMKVSSSGFGYVKEGQTVNVRLNGFPYIEFGILKGKITRISQVPEILPNGSVYYNVEVVFPEGLISSYGKTFPFIQGMDGKADIITKDTRLIEHFIDPIISLLIN